MEITTLQASLRGFHTFLSETCGYDTVLYCDLIIKESGHFVLQYSVADDFQDELDYKNRVANGFEQVTSTENSVHKALGEFWDHLGRIPSRPERELRVLMRQAGTAAEMLNHLRTAAAREFAERLIDERAMYKGLLQDMEALRRDK